MAANTASASFWLHAYGAYAPEPALSGDIDADVAIIGGGFTGLSTAWHLRRADPAMQVAVLEAEDIGFGASGRNGGFSMTLFGLEPELTRLCFGVERTKAAHHYMAEAVDYVRDVVEQQCFRSHYRHPGFLRVAVTPGAVQRLQRHHAFLERLGLAEDFEWRDREVLREAFPDSPFLGGLYEPRGGLLDPARHVREWKRLALEGGVQVYEQTPVTRIERGERITLHTSGGRVRARRLVLATNAWTHRLRGQRGARSRQQPAWTYQIVTRPLNAQEWARIGWRAGEGIEDNRNLIHYFRPTVDGRITFGGGDVHVGFGSDMDHDRNPRIWSLLERDLARLFPSLRGVDIDFRWGGPVSVTLDLVPAIGYLGDERVLYSCGCMGHGVSLSQYNGLTIAELLLGQTSERTAAWFVERSPLPWPPEPFTWLGKRAVTGALRTQDRFRDGAFWRRTVQKSRPS